MSLKDFRLPSLGDKLEAEAEEVKKVEVKKVKAKVEKKLGGKKDKK